MIKQLMSQTLDEKFAGTWSVMDMQDLEKFAGRFAELIVQDCAKMLDEDSYIVPELGGYAYDIRKRYGVK
jgi:transcriptional regulator of NAD metabolism